MTKKYLSMLLVIIVFISAIFFTFKFLSPPKAVHLHAGFQIYMDEKLLDFSDYKYMSLIPCTDNGKQDVHGKVHLHDGVGNIVHVHATHVTWGNLFTYLKFSIPPSKEVISYVNGKKVETIQNIDIKAYDSLVIIIGTHQNIADYLKKSLTKQDIKIAETKNGICKG